MQGNKGNGICGDGKEFDFEFGRKPAAICQSETVVGENIYAISRSGDESPSLKIQIFNKKTAEWLMPAVHGEISVPHKCHSAVLLNEDRIMVILMGASVDECAWFLEVDTPFTNEQKKLLGTEVVAWSKGVFGDCLKPIVITGPSGVGKGTLIAKLMEDFPSTFGFSVSHTTRLPREREKNGVHYHFTERSVMEKDIQDGKFLEFACVHGNLYGTSIEAVEAVTNSGKRCILDIDVQGARSVRASSVEATFIFIAPPSFKELEKRLRGRGTETEEQVQKRLRNAISEIGQANYPGLFDHILINDSLETCYLNLKKILGLDERMPNIQQNGSRNNEYIVCNLETRTCHEFTLKCESNNMFILDVQSLKGGAPGQTSGLKISPIAALT